MGTAVALLVGAVFGFTIAAVIVGWIWVELTEGDDHPLTGEEIMERVGEVYR